MNSNLEQLFSVAQKKRKLILGLMSGTSLDGLDLALCALEGSGTDTHLEVLSFRSAEYDSAWVEQVQRVFAQEQVSLYELSALNVLTADLHASIVLDTLKGWKLKPEDVDVLASHGQTVFHGPQKTFHRFPNNTLQLGDGDHLAVKTGMLTLSDFRQKHLAAGGEGAPLVSYGDYFLFRDPKESRMLLNIGGISNLTFLPAGADHTAIQSTDIGPGNTLMNQYAARYLNRPYDEDGKIAAEGLVSLELLQALTVHPFFQQPFPKTTGPELFNLALLKEVQKQSKTDFLGHEDVMATLNAFTCYAVSHAVEAVSGGKADTVIYISGGGVYNNTLINRLRRELSRYPLLPFNALGIPPEAKEAALFALLANETLSGNPDLIPDIPGAPKVSMGKVSFPR